jgi:hypothetical protein
LVVAEVEVGVAGQAHHGGGVRARRQLDRDPVLQHLEVSGGGQFAGEALIAVRADDPEGGVCRAVLDDVPGPPVEAVRPAVEVVAPVVGGYPHLAAVQLEAAAGDPVGVAADRAADVRRGREVLGRRAVAQDHVAAVHH